MVYLMAIADIIQSVTPEELKERREKYKSIVSERFANLLKENNHKLTHCDVSSLPKPIPPGIDLRIDYIRGNLYYQKSIPKGFKYGKIDGDKIDLSGKIIYENSQRVKDTIIELLGYSKTVFYPASYMDLQGVSKEAPHWICVDVDQLRDTRSKFINEISSIFPEIKLTFFRPLKLFPEISGTKEYKKRNFYGCHDDCWGILFEYKSFAPDYSGTIVLIKSDGQSIYDALYAGNNIKKYRYVSRLHPCDFPFKIQYGIKTSWKHLVPGI